MSNKLTLLPEYIDLVQQPSVEFYKSGTNLLDAFSAYTGELNAAISFEKSLSVNDVVKSTSNLYKELNNGDFKGTLEGVEYDFDDSFKLFYIEKFQTLTNDVKDLMTSSFSDSNIYFKNFSDDTGMLLDINSILDNSTMNYQDLYNNNSVYYSSYLPASVISKVSDNEKTMSTTLGIHTDFLLRGGLNSLANNGNLGNDYKYFSRALEYRDQLLPLLKTTTVLGKMADFINFFKKINYKDKDENRTALFLKYKQNIEGTEIKIDILKNKLEKSIPNTLLVSQEEDQEVTRPSTNVGTSIQ